MQNKPGNTRLSALITSYCFSQAIFCAASLGIADELAEGPKTAEQLAISTGCFPPYLERLMRALCSIGVFRESEQGFNLTQMSTLLRKNVEGSLWPLASFHGNEMYKTFGCLLEGLRGDANAWDMAMGMPLWDYLARYQDRGAIFDSMMRINHEDDLSALVDACEFSEGNIIADLGGGDGSMLREALRKHPASQGILFDLPDVIARAKADSVWAGVVERCRFYSGDFFESAIPGGADVYIMRHVLHDWSDDRCLQLLRRCQTVMTGGSRLLVIEAIIDGHGGWANWSDLGVMVFGGRERSLSDYANLCASAGFISFRQLHSKSRVALMEAFAP